MSGATIKVLPIGTRLIQRNREGQMSNKKPLKGNRLPFTDALLMSVIGTTEQQKHANRVLKKYSKRGANHRSR